MQICTITSKKGFSSQKQADAARYQSLAGYPMEPQPPAVSTQKPDVAAKHGADRRTSARLFVGIKIAPEIAGELAKIANAVADPLVRRIPATDLHLTLVAPWNEEDIAAATQALTAVLKPIRSFDLAFEHVVYGPTRDRPKLLWTECAPTPELAVLGKLLSLAFHQIDNRPSRPHVTLARLGENGPRIARKYPLDRALSLRQKVRSIELFRSTQQQGRGYEIIASVPLHEEALDMSDPATDISRHVWETKYRYVSPGIAEHSIDDTRRRIAHAVAAAEPADQAEWERRFCALLQDFKFLPGGRIQAGAGTGRNVTLFNCFVIGTIEDSIPGIFSALQESATTMQQGGGIGCDFSTLRPRGTIARSVGSIASGPVSFMRVWDPMCDTILSTGARRGAMMATLRCNHPDIEEFIAAKKQAGALRHFNLSVLVTNEFMAAVRADADWPLMFPASALNGDGPTVLRQWSAIVRCHPVPRY